MATLQKIRNLSGLLVTVIGVALLAFIAGDLLSSGNTIFNSGNRDVAVVNGEAITAEEFQAKLSQQGDQLNDDGKNRLFGQMVMSKAIIDCAENIGISVCDEELSDIILGDNPSPMVLQRFANPETGEFDNASLIEYVNNIFSADQSAMSDEEKQQYAYFQYDWKIFEEAVKEERLNMKLLNLISTSLMPNDVDLEASFAERTGAVDIEYVSQAYTTLPDSVVTVTPEEVKALYAKKRESFVTKGYRSIEYVSVPVTATPEDYNATEAQFMTLAEEFKTAENVRQVQNTQCSKDNETVSKMPTRMKEFVGKAKVDEVSEPFFENNTYGMYRVISKTVSPDSVEARHIMFTFDQETLCDSVLTALKSGADFATLVKDHSIDRNTVENGGSFGWFTEPMGAGMGTTFVEAAFSGTKGLQKIKTPYGIHILEVTKATKPVEKAKVAQLLVEVKPSQATRDAQYNKVRNYISTTGAENFAAGDPANGIYVQSTRIVKADVALNNIRNARQIIQWAFNAEPNEVSKIYDIDKNHYVVAKVTGVCEDEYEAFEDVESLLKAQLVREKKGEKLVEIFSGFDSFEAASEKLAVDVKTAESVVFNTPMFAQGKFEPKLVGQAPYATVGELKTVAGVNDAYLYKVVNKNEAEPTFDKANEMLSYRAMLDRMINNGYYRLIEELSEIEDNRTIFY